MMMSTPEGLYKIRTFYGKLAYIGFLAYGGILTETSVNHVWKTLFNFFTAYTAVVAIGGTMVYSFQRWHDELSLVERMFTLINMGGASALYLGYSIFMLYKDAAKSSIKSIDNHFYTDLRRQEVTNSSSDIVNLTQMIYLIVSTFAFGNGAYLVVRPIEIAVVGSQGMNNTFLQVGFLPLEFIERRCGLAVAYWLTCCLVAPTIVYVIVSATLFYSLISILPGAICNHFWYLRCRIVKDSRISEQNFEEYGSSNNEMYALETRKVVRRYVQYFQCYQKLIKALNEIREYTEVHYSVFYAATLILSVPSGILLTWSRDTSIYAKISLVLLTFPTVLMLVIFAHLGKLIDEVNDEMKTCLYDSPWIYLSPKERQTLITFMSMLQTPITLQIFKIRPVTLSMLVRFCQLNYSIMNFIRMRSAFG